MRHAVGSATMLEQQLEHSLRELGHERDRVRTALAISPVNPVEWAELETRASIAELVGRKATPAAMRTVDGALAAVRAFREGLMH